MMRPTSTQLLKLKLNNKRQFIEVFLDRQEGKVKSLKAIIIIIIIVISISICLLY